jgi:hypothetical protein
LKIRKLLKNKNAKNAQTSKIGPNWNVSGTWDFHPSRKKGAVGSGEIRTLTLCAQKPLHPRCQIFQLSDVVSIPALAPQFKVIQVSVFVFTSKVSPVNRSFPSFLYQTMSRWNGGTLRNLQRRVIGK